MRCRISAVLSGSAAVCTGGEGGVGGVGTSLVTETASAGTPSVSNDKLPETLFRRTSAPPPWILVTFDPCPIRVVVAGNEERILPLTLLNSALQRVSVGTSMRTLPETELK